MVESETKWFTRFESERREFKEGWVSESGRGVFKERWFISSINRRRSSRRRRANLCKTNSFLQVSGPARFFLRTHTKNSNLTTNTAKNKSTEVLSSFGLDELVGSHEPTPQCENLTTLLLSNYFGI
jgi:hypothetical protein